MFLSLFGPSARPARVVQAAEERLRQAEQDTPLSQTSPPEFANSAECAKQQEALASEVSCEAVVYVANLSAREKPPMVLRTIT